VSAIIMLCCVFVIAFFLASNIEMVTSRYLGAPVSKLMVYAVSFSCTLLAFYFNR